MNVTKSNQGYKQMV